MLYKAEKVVKSRYSEWKGEPLQTIFGDQFANLHLTT